MFVEEEGLEEGLGADGALNDLRRLFGVVDLDDDLRRFQLDLKERQFFVPKTRS